MKKEPDPAPERCKWGYVQTDAWSGPQSDVIFDECTGETHSIGFKDGSYYADKESME